MWKRWRGEHIPLGPFQLGKWRTPINVFAVIFTVFTCLFLLFPEAANPTAVSMNWTIVLIGGILIISAVWWFIEGRKSFVGPNIEATLNRHLE